MRGVAILLATALAGSTPAPLQIAPDDFGTAGDRQGAGFCAARTGRGQVALDEFRGKVVAVTFIFASCSATCPILTAKMATVQDRLGSDFGSKIAFLSITVDPEHDNSDVLKRYATAFGADPAGWKFLTGSPDSIRAVEHRYGVFASQTAGRELDHTNLISLVDRGGMLRVQYLGVRFDPDELHRDLVSLVGKP